MKQAYFITGTDTGVGKTALTTLLVEFLRAEKIRVAAFKPLCSGGREDAGKIFTALGGGAPLDEINPWHFRAPLAPLLAARRERKAVKLSQVLAHICAAQKKSDVALIEGAGGMLSPLGEDFDSLDLILKLNAIPVIVAPNKLGAVNHVLLTLAALPEKFRRRCKIVFMSPPKPDSATASNPKLLAEFFPAQKIFTLPWLGNDFDPAAARKIPRTRKTLAALVRT